MCYQKQLYQLAVQAVVHQGQGSKPDLAQYEAAWEAALRTGHECPSHAASELFIVSQSALSQWHLHACLGCMSTSASSCGLKLWCCVTLDESRSTAASDPPNSDLRGDMTS